MDAIYQRCCGIDVHKKLIVACLRVGRKEEIRSFGTSTDEICQMITWLEENRCESTAMESTGSFWKPLNVGCQMGRPFSCARSIREYSVGLSL